MFKTPAMRLSIVLVLLTVNLLFLANMTGFVPDDAKSVLEQRKVVSESLALQFSAAAEKGAFQIIQNTMRAMVERNEDIRSAAIRTENGRLIALAGEHLAHWGTSTDMKSTHTHVTVPVYRKGKKWARVEIRFAPLWSGWMTNRFAHSFAGLVIFLISGGFICYFIVIKRTLRELDPSAVIPERVQKAFDVLQEGVLIMDDKEQIVMVNKSFSDLTGKSPEAMIGLKGSEIGWLNHKKTDPFKQLPWLSVLHDGLEQKGASLTLMNKPDNKIKLSVNAAMVADNTGKCRGVLVTFGDITQLEEKNFELSEMNERLQLANMKIKGKSQELEFLASCDPMTHCLNRRSLGESFDLLFKQAKINETELSCFMADIDFFKSVNDNYGHATGDEVIKTVADVLKKSTRDTDLVGRYGGEEFCVVLPGLDLDLAAKIAERIRQTIEKKSCSGIKITISQGVSSLAFNAGNPEELINQADKALYAAKKSGRNRVVTWGKDIDSMLETESIKNDEDENQEKALQPEEQAASSENTDTGQEELKHRVAELESLLEKRNPELDHYKMYDFKTGLPTLTLFEDRITREIARSKRLQTLLAVISVNIDTIRRVHETLGYKTAENLVAGCGQRLNDVLREKIDTVAVIENIKTMPSVSLINETEFGILLTDINQVDHVTWVMKRMLDSFKKPFRINDNEIYASAYFGVSIFPHDGETMEVLYSSATNACSYAKKHNGNAAIPVQNKIN